MRLPKLASLTLATLLAAASTTAPAAGGEEAAYPSKPIQIVVPYAPGGSADFSARQIANRLEARLGQAVTVVNRPGASGEIGVTAVARSPADGHTLLLALNTELVILPQLGRKLSYTLDQFEPISIVGSTPLVLIGRKQFKARDFKALVQEIREVPGQYNFGGAPGSPAHISGEWLKHQASLAVEHVPYKGGAQAATDVAGGHLALYFSGILPARALIQSGAVVPYATTGRQRSSIIPAVPTMEESGLKDFVMGNWTALLAPKGTPPAVVSRLKSELTGILADPALRAAMQSEGIEVPPQEPAPAFIANEERRYRELVKTLQIKAL